MTQLLVCFKGRLGENFLDEHIYIIFIAKAVYKILICITSHLMQALGQG